MLKTMLSSIVARHFKKKIDSWTIKEEDVEELLREIRIALLDADVSLIVVKKFIKDIRTIVVGKVLSQNEDPQKYIIGVIKDELVKILNNEKKIDTNKNNLKIMLVGLQGSGKTTTCAKLAYLLQKKFNKKPLLVGLDIYRPAAIEQLKTLADSYNIDFYANGKQNPVKTSDEALTYAKTNNDNVIIFDTAGRLQTNDELMEELVNVRNKISPDYIIFIADAMAGQEIINVAGTFNNYLHLDGIIITKLDGDARAGAALSITSIINVPIFYTGTGEKIDALQQFFPDRMADRILGFGDIISFTETAQGVIDEQKTKKSFAKMLSGKMDLEDMMVQMQEMNKLGSLSAISKMLPNANTKIDEQTISESEKKIWVWQTLLNSMTKKERRNPILFKKEPLRKTRVIKGSGRKPEEFNRLIKEWESARERMSELGKKIMKGQNPLSFLN
ncbi:MAG: signal recognition particle protein [Mycoplasmataceae bacterium]|nr:signal recognition particle protein [Mycoplasmataceae bacterium]